MKADAKKSNAVGVSSKPLVGRAPLIDSIKEQWNSANGFAQSVHVAERLRDTVFTEAENRRLEHDFDRLFPYALWQKVRGGTARQAIVAVCVATGFMSEEVGRALLKKYGETPMGDEASLEAAIAEGGLVFVEWPREVYWEKNRLDIDWSRLSQPWSFFLQLATLGNAGLGLDVATFRGPESAHGSSLRSLKGRLVNLPGFPPDLKAHVKRAGRGTYTLRTLKGRIRVLWLKSSEKLIESPT